MTTPKVYLAGPINGCSDAEAMNWRNTVHNRLGPGYCLDPMRRDYRGREDDFASEIVAHDKTDIFNSAIVLANCSKPGWGTAMEIFYAFSHSKPVVAVIPEDAPVSPWVRQHTVRVFTSFFDAVEFVADYLKAIE